MRTIEITLGGRSFAVAQLPIRAEQAWRDACRELVERIRAGLGLYQRTIESAADVEAAIRFAGAMTDGTGALDALCAYSPALAAEREWLLDHAYSDEAAAAVVKLFFAQAGLAPAPATNGAAPLPSPTI